MKIKTLPAKIKAAGEQDGLEDGQFEAIVATYDVDSVGDKIVPGAFKGTLERWAASGNPIPMYWSHRMDDPDFNIGEVLDAKETDDGLWVKGQLDLDSPKAATTHKLMKGRRVTQFSFAYDVLDGGFVQQKDDGDQQPGGFYELRELELFETGPTPIGANTQTELLDVKSASSRASVLVQGGDAALVAQVKALLDEVKDEPEPDESDEDEPTDDSSDEADDEKDGEYDEVTVAGTTYQLVPKTAGVRFKAGRTLSAKNETALNDAVKQITGGVSTIKTVLDSVASGTVSDDEGKASSTRSATSDAPAGKDAGNEERPAGFKPANLSLINGAQELELALDA